jgi:hypothetical protein
MEKPTKIEDIASTIKMNNQLDEFQEKFNTQMTEGNKLEDAPTVSESTEVPKVENPFEEHRKEEEQREHIEKVKRDIENNMIVSVDGKSSNDNIFVSEKIIAEEPKPKKKWWQF